jgi:DNA polymerase-4
MSDQKALRRIIHIDMDAFYASVEQRDNSKYRGVPIAVGGDPSKRGVIAASSYEARSYGVKSAMSSNKAKQLCPDLIIVPPRFDAYKAVSKSMHEVFSNYTTKIEPLSLDEAYLDVTESCFDIYIAAEVAKEIRDTIFQNTGLRSSAGISINKFLAKVASDVNKPNGQKVIAPKEISSFLSTLPLTRFHGIGVKTLAKMNSCGINTSNDLKERSREELMERFGKAGLYYFNISRGIDEREVKPDRERKSIGSEQTFEQDLHNLSQMINELEKVGAEVLNRMHSNSIYGQTLTLKVKYHDFNQVTRSKTLSTLFTEKEIINKVAKELLFQTDVSEKPVRLLGLSVSNLKTHHLQLKLKF